MNHFFNHQTTFPSQEDIETSVCDNLKMEEEKKVKQKKVINQKNKCL